MFHPGKVLLVEKFVRIRQWRSRILRGRSSTETGQPPSTEDGWTQTVENGAGQVG